MEKLSIQMSCGCSVEKTVEFVDEDDKQKLLSFWKNKSCYGCKMYRSRLSSSLFKEPRRRKNQRPGYSS